jgi:tetratricopeptide (TPR) repeat protein/predicted Ser/Thr protein kinase
MNPERFRQIEDLYNAVLECEPQAGIDLLAAADPDLRSEVESLLDRDNCEEPIASRVMAAAAILIGDEPAEDVPVAESMSEIGRRIGPYRILARIGEGGMGVVYQAQQEQPRRLVALKIIKPGWSSPELLRRFQQEAQALGRLQHPGIAMIYEAGTAADAGPVPLPYFAMEFIQGTSLGKYADDHGLTTRERLEIMAKVCDAVDHAHQRGIIHRDLKPGNILVDETGQPKILDFGVARVTDSDVHSTRQTDLGQLLGTVAYMSPEQVLADPLELDTRSDVYALGVILYELLAGRLPYSISPKLHEAVQTIRQEDPAPLRSIVRTCRGDIETLVAKALEKERARRYGSAAALAADIRRYLGNEPTTARPASIAYQLQKLARRHSTFVGGVAAVFVVLVTGIVASAWEAMRARRAEQTAEAVRDFLQHDLLAQAAASVQASPDTRPDPDLKVRTALDRAGARIAGKFDAQPAVEAAIRQTIAATYLDLGLYPEAEQHVERALELRRRMLGERNAETLQSMSLLADTYRLQSRYPQAEALLRKVLLVQRRLLGENNPAVWKTIDELGGLDERQGKFSEAELFHGNALEMRQRVLGEAHPDTLDSMNNLGVLYASEGKYAQAEQIEKKALEIRRRVQGAEHPGTLTNMDDLGEVYRLGRKYPQAESLLSEALAARRRVLGEEHPDTLVSMNNLALVYRMQGKNADAAPLLTKALEIKRRVLGETHRETLASMHNLASLYRSEASNREAEQLFTAVLQADRHVLGEEHPDTLTAANSLAMVRRNLEKYTEAEILFRKTLDARRRVLGEEHPETLTSIAELAESYRRRGDYAQAEALLVKVGDSRRRLLGANHIDTLVTLSLLGLVRLQQNRYGAAEATLREALQGYQNASLENWRRYYCENLLGAAVAGQKRYVEAEPLFRSGDKGIAERQPAIPAEFQRLIQDSRKVVAQVRRTLGR